jgi:hypothetical protein
MSRITLALTATGVCALAASLWADTLVLRNGRRIEGELVGVRDGMLEFREYGFRGRTQQFDRQDVARIEFDADSGQTPGLPLTGRPRGLREREVAVAANTQWNDAGISVRAGQTVYFVAEGRVRWGPDRRDGPAGENNSPRNPNRPIPNRPGAALIGRIGDDSGDYFFIGGDQGPIRMRGSGRLFLGINDDYLADNSGSFRVVIYY